MEKHHPNKTNLLSSQSPEICTLANSGNYFLQRVQIIRESNRYRLLVIHDKKVLANQFYEKLKGAKIAFLKLFWYRAWSEDVKPVWTKLYPPLPEHIDSLNEQIEIALRENDKANTEDK